jgi:enterochelin esterase-like enzyme
MEHYLLRAQKEGTPLIDGETVTYVWQGKTAPALVNDLFDWEENPVEMVAVGLKTWIFTHELPRNAYLEYAFWDPESDTRFPDPFNPRRTPNGFGRDNHFYYMPEASPHPITRRRKGGLQGQLIRTKVSTEEFAAGANRTVYLYQPPVDDPVPLVVVYDGNDFVQRGRLPVVLENLMAQNRIPPLALAMVANHKQARALEYACSDWTLGFLTERILPLAYENLNLRSLDEAPGSFGIMGASMSGLMAFYTGFRLPEIFGKVLCNSGAFAIPEHEFVLFDLIRYAPLPSLKLWMGVGMFEQLVETNRQMHLVLESRGLEHAYYEYPGAHNYTSWRNHYWSGLEYLFSH